MLSRMIHPPTPPPDHYIVISCDSAGHTSSRFVIACGPADAEETHREHYPGADIIGVVSNE